MLYLAHVKEFAEESLRCNFLASSTLLCAALYRAIIQALQGCSDSDKVLYLLRHTVA